MIVHSEPVPGALHDPQEMAQAAAKGAAYTLGAYEPIVINAEVKNLMAIRVCRLQKPPPLCGT